MLVESGVEENKIGKIRPRFLWFLGFFAIATIALAMVLSASSATPPSQITYQGKLLINGSAASTSQSMYFIIYDSESGGSALYTASGTVGSPAFVSVTPSSGLFTVNLGGSGTNALDSSIFKNYSDLFLEVRVSSETLSPRKRLTASPYALNSQYLSGYSALTNSTTVAYIPLSDASGNFNFNNVTSTRLSVSGTIDITGSGYLALNGNNYSQYFISSAGNSGELWVSDGSGAGLWTATSSLGFASSSGSNNYIQNQFSANQTANYRINGIGSMSTTTIGTSTPEFKLTIDGDGGIIARGEWAVGTNLVTSGAGTRMIWYPKKAAFRAGRVSGAQWDEANIGDYSVAFGQGTVADGDNSVALGESTTSSGRWSAAFGLRSVADGDNSFAAGESTVASAYGSVAFGGDTRASDAYAFAGGIRATANGDASFAFGQDVSATNYFSQVFGDHSTVAGGWSFANGYYNLIATSSDNSSVFGDSNKAYGSYSHILGSENQATGTHSIVLGYNNFTTAGGSYGTAIGYQNTVSGTRSMAFGRNMIVTGSDSFGVNVSSTSATLSQNNTIALMGGNVGVGTTTPDAGLTVMGTAGNNAIANFATSTGASVMYISPAGKVGIGTTTIGNMLEVDGSSGIMVRRAMGSVGQALNHLSMERRGSNNSVNLQSVADGSNITAFALDFGFYGERMRVDGSTGNVGFGTSTLAAKLNVLATTEQLRLIYNSSNYTSFTVDSGGNLSISPTGGKVGVNTSTPAYALTVSGDLAVTGTIRLGDSMASGTYGQLLMSTGTGATWTSTSSLGLSGSDIGGFTTGSIIFASTSGKLTQDNSNLYWDDTNNRLGIGTTTPSYPLHIGLNNASPQYVYAYNKDGGMTFTAESGNAGTYVGMDLYHEGSGITRYNGISMNIQPNTHDFWFQMRKNNVDTGVFTITNANNYVGFGTTAPSGTLHAVVSGKTGIIVAPSTAYIGINTTTPNSSLVVVGTAGNNSLINFTSSTGASALYIGANGNVGIGTTTPGSKLHVYSASESIYPKFESDTSSVYMLIDGIPDQYDQIGGFTVYNAGDSVGSFTVYKDGANDAGALTIFTQPTGGNNTERMRIKSNGNVGINTTTPNEKLTVVGTAGNNAMLNVASSTGASALYIGANGNVGMGTISPSYRLTVSGDLAVTGTIRLGDTMASGTYGQLLMSTGTGATWTSTSSLGLIGGSGSSGQISYWTGAGTISGSSTFVYNATTGNVGIGTTTPSERLTVVGNISNLITNESNVRQVATLTVGSSPYAIFVSGRYAYVANHDSNSISVVDISVPSSPAQIATTSVGAGPESIYVSGRYAYVANSNSSSISVVDVSNPAAPIQIATTSVGSVPQSIYVSGHYAYVANVSSDSISVIDIANPAAPIQIATTSVGDQPLSIYVLGRYAYVVEAGSPDSMSVIDISNPTAPIKISSTSVGGYPTSIYVSGRYAYVANENNASIDIVDISNPNVPVKIATGTISGQPGSIYVSGRYAYVADQVNEIFSIVDISNPSTPVFIKNIDFGTSLDLRSVYVSGRYAYMVQTTANKILIVDISGTEVSSLMAHSAEVGALQSRDGIIAIGNVQGDSLLAGAGGIMSQGALSVFASSTGATSSIFNISSAQTANILSVLPNGNVGIGTSTPEFKLDLASDGGIISRGTFGSGASLTTSGEGTRMFWYPRKAAFRAGYVDGIQWNNTIIGDYSVAMGYLTTASGSYSSAFGYNNTASNEAAFAAGKNNTASGNSSFVGGGSYNNASTDYTFIGGGQSNFASGTNSFVGGGTSSVASGLSSAVIGGAGNYAIGQYSFVSGYNNIANGNYSSVLGGQFNTSTGINATVLGAYMTVSGNYSFGINVSTTPASLSQANTIALMGGNVGIGTTTPSSTLFVNGTAGGTGAWNNWSDERLKTNIETITNAVEKVKMLRGVEYDWIDPSHDFPGRKIGFIAQEALPVLPEVVNDIGGIYGISYGPVVALLTEAIKEQQAQIDALKAGTTTLSISGVASGTITYVIGDLNLNGYSILNVKNVQGIAGKWLINESGLLIAKVQTSEGEKQVYGVASENAELSLSGSAALVNGEAIIIFPTSTREMIDETAPIKVIPALTSGDCKGIYISQKGASGFTVKELDGGVSSATFDWLVIARRKFTSDAVIPEESTGSSAGGSEAPSADEPPPAEAPASGSPTTEEPPTETPPSEEPVATEPPAEQAPPTEAPPAETPPAEEAPPTEAPPAETPPVETPPAE